MRSKIPHMKYKCKKIPPCCFSCCLVSDLIMMATERVAPAQRLSAAVTGTTASVPAASGEPHLHPRGGDCSAHALQTSLPSSQCNRKLKEYIECQRGRRYVQQFVHAYILKRAGESKRKV